MHPANKKQCNTVSHWLGAYTKRYLLTDNLNWLLSTPYNTKVLSQHLIYIMVCNVGKLKLTLQWKNWSKFLPFFIHFEILHRVRPYHCCALCKISKWFNNCNWCVLANKIDKWHFIWYEFKINLYFISHIHWKVSVVHLMKFLSLVPPEFAARSKNFVNIITFTF